ncbi:MAG: hypothetical protein ASARMPREDX12_000542 [Alectoria sarmentosa]|nr:MAG: hypothetical protein ASARMPREDX12_000542 [Alectoria sarmentosa]CAD6574924.1 MAG: hypothetical protein ASARMPRED_006988 [Alectoria sarmentosa]
MPTSPTAASARVIHARRTRLRRGAPGSATAEGTRSSGDSEGKSEESEVAEGLVINNRFAVLRPNEPAPSMQERREYTLPLDPIFHRERLVTLPLQTDILLIDQTSSSEKIKDKSSALPFPAIPCPKGPSILRLAPLIPANSGQGTEAAASISPSKPPAQPSPLVLQADAQSVRSSEPPSARARLSPDLDTAAPYLSLLAPQSAPALPSPPIPRDPMSKPSLGILPVHPSLDLKSLTSSKSFGPKCRQFAPPTPTSFDIFRSDDTMRHIVRTTSGKIFAIAAEIAAANEKSKMRPVGNVMVPAPGPAKKFGDVKGKIDRSKSDHGSGEYVKSLKEMEDESEEGDGEAEEWLGKEKGFWQQPFEEGSVEKTRTQTRRDRRR